MKPYVTAYYPLLVRGVLKLHRKLYRDPVRRRMLAAFLKNTGASPHVEPGLPFSAHTLICNRDLRMGICAAKSLNLACEKALPWVFHDDGSLGPEDIRLLSVHFPGARIVTRAESDASARQALTRFPHLRRWRQDQFYLLKIPDVSGYAPREKVLFMDTDVLFFRKPEWMLDALYRPAPLVNAFNKDISTHYSLDSGAVSGLLGKKVEEQINVGLWVMNKSDLDLQKTDAWLSRFPPDLPPLKKRLAEQTLLAMLASDSPHGVACLPPTYDVSFEKRPEDSVCKHYVGRIRHGFELEGLRHLINKLDFIDRWRTFAGNSRKS